MLLQTAASMHGVSSEKESNPVGTEAAAYDDLPPPINKKNAPTPIRASASNESSTMKERKAVLVSDNKENIDSESKPRTKFVVKDASEAAIKLEPSNKVKEVTVTSKLDNNEGGNEVNSLLLVA